VKKSVFKKIAGLMLIAFVAVSLAVIIPVAASDKTPNEECDVDESGFVNFADVILVLDSADFNKAVGTNTRLDVNDDGFVDIDDVIWIIDAMNFNKEIGEGPIITDTPTPTPPPDIEKETIEPWTNYLQNGYFEDVYFEMVGEAPEYWSIYGPSPSQWGTSHPDFACMEDMVNVIKWQPNDFPDFFGRFDRSIGIKDWLDFDDADRKFDTGEYLAMLTQPVPGRRAATPIINSFRVMLVNTITGLQQHEIYEARAWIKTSDITKGLHANHGQSEYGFFVSGAGIRRDAVELVDTNGSVIQVHTENAVTWDPRSIDPSWTGTSCVCHSTNSELSSYTSYDFPLTEWTRVSFRFRVLIPMQIEVTFYIKGYDGNVDTYHMVPGTDLFPDMSEVYVNPDADYMLFDNVRVFKVSEMN